MKTRLGSNSKKIRFFNFFRQVQNGIKETVKTLEDEKEKIRGEIGTMEKY